MPGLARIALAEVMLAGAGGSAVSAGSRVPAWKTFIAEAESGHVDRTYSCATVQEAIFHLRPTLLPFSTVGRTVHAYLKHACRR